MNQRFLLFTGTNGEEPLVVPEGVDGVDFRSVELVVTIENLGSGALLVIILVARLGLLHGFLVFVAQVAEHVLEIGIADVTVVTACVGYRVALALGEGGIGNGGVARILALFGREDRFFANGIAQVNGIARVNPVRILDVAVVFPKVRPGEGILEEFVTQVPKGIAFLDNVGRCQQGANAKTDGCTF
jgi:hypothetical protein